jgi:hypothetical protein
MYFDTIVHLGSKAVVQLVKKRRRFQQYFIVKTWTFCRGIIAVLLITADNFIILQLFKKIDVKVFINDHKILNNEEAVSIINFIKCEWWNYLPSGGLTLSIGTQKWGFS